MPEAWQVKWRPATQDDGVTTVKGLGLSAAGYGEAVYAGPVGRGSLSGPQVPRQASPGLGTNALSPAATICP